MNGLSKWPRIEISNSYINIFKSGSGKFILTFPVIILYNYTSSSLTNNNKSTKEDVKCFKFSREREWSGESF